MRILICALAILAVPATSALAGPFEFHDGDRVVLIGSTLIEREQSYGYWEAAITARNPDKNISFRNLGWSGDTVWGEARAVFGSPADGYKALIDHVKAEKPTVIIVGYGTNESFAGEKGLSKFKEQYKKLLNDLAVTKARFVLLSPTKMEKLPPPMPDLTKSNENLKMYRDMIEDIAEFRGAGFIDLFGDVKGLTENGINLSARGYWSVTSWLFCGPNFGMPTGFWFRPLSWTNKNPGMTFKLAAGLPIVFEDKTQGHTDIVFQARDLPAGNYVLRIDNKDFIKASDTEWKKGKNIVSPDQDQAEGLRKAIIEKNELYFHRWRPQNVTYLFLFRKHEQGNNAVEIPKFDPLIETKEKEIGKLRVPREHTYELVPEKK